MGLHSISIANFHIVLPSWDSFLPPTHRPPATLQNRGLSLRRAVLSTTSFYACHASLLLKRGASDPSRMIRGYVGACSAKTADHIHHKTLANLIRGHPSWVRHSGSVTDHRFSGGRVGRGANRECRGGGSKMSPKCAYSSVRALYA